MSVNMTNRALTPLKIDAGDTGFVKQRKELINKINRDNRAGDFLQAAQAKLGNAKNAAKTGGVGSRAAMGRGQSGLGRNGLDAETAAFLGSSGLLGGYGQSESSGIDYESMLKYMFGGSGGSRFLGSLF